MIRRFRLSVCGSLALMLWGCSDAGKDKTQPTAASPVHNVFVTMPVQIDGGGTLSLPATIEEARTISVGFKTAGQIERIYVKEGDRVTAGQPVAMLDTTDYALGIGALREKFNQLKIENERRSRLHASGNMSDNDYENAISGMRQLELQLKLEENKLGYCRLAAPASGIVTKVNFEASEMVDAGTPVIELMDNSRLEAIVDLPVRQYIDRDKFIAFTGESAMNPGHEFELHMLSLTPRADNSQLYRLRLGVPADAGVTPGMTVTVKIKSDGSASGPVKVPLSAVFESEGSRYVWQLNPSDSTVTARRVATQGCGEGGMVEILSGISAADVIVRAGVHHLTEGEKVNVIAENSESNPGNVL